MTKTKSIKEVWVVFFPTCKQETTPLTHVCVLLQQDEHSQTCYCLIYLWDIVIRNKTNIPDAR